MILWPTPDEFTQLVEAHNGKWVIDTETDGLDVRGPNAPHTAHYIGLHPLGKDVCCIFRRPRFELVRRAVEGLELIGHNVRFDIHALDLRPNVPPYDTLVGAYFENTVRRLSLDHFAAVNGWPKIGTPDLIKQGRILEMDPHQVAEYLADDCIRTGQLFTKLRTDRPELCPDYAVSAAVARMEARGIRLLQQPLNELGRTLRFRRDELRSALVGEGFDGNPGSSKQVGEWLTLHGRRLPRTPSGNLSTAKLVLSSLVDKGDNLAKLLLDFRQADKLVSAFVEPLPTMTRDNILYPQVNITRTKTGRFSYSDPNLQQIPKRSEFGAKFRLCFTSATGNGVSGADYSQVELRVSAALAQEPVLLDAFAAGRDPHTEVAAKMLGKRVDEISSQERFGAKAVNFGILNGMGARRLATELKSPVSEATKFLSDYRRSLPQLTEWMEQVWRESEAYYIAETVAGRKRIYSMDEETRPAISVVVQGSAAELMRRALVAVDASGLKPILVVHDEIIVEGTGHGEMLADIMRDAANQAYPSELKGISFDAEGGEGATWADV
jgi:DNA polymerase-1